MIGHIGAARRPLRSPVQTSLAGGITSRRAGPRWPVVGREASTHNNFGTISSRQSRKKNGFVGATDHHQQAGSCPKRQLA